jgi:putative phosphoesterase
MRVGIISDTHDRQDRTRRAIQLLKAEGAEALFHCGDLIESAMVGVCAVMPCYFVFGNNDADSVPEIRKAIDEFADAVCLQWGGEVELAGKRIAMTHGHLQTDVRRLLAASPDYLFSGHSHIAADWRAGKTRRINPGALHRASSLTVALLNLENDELRFLVVPK